MKYSSYLAFDNEKSQKSFKEVFDSLLGNDGSIHYSDNTHREILGDGTELEQGLPTITGIVMGAAAGVLGGGPAGGMLGQTLGLTIGAGIGRAISEVRYNTEWGHKAICGWCWECTYQSLVKKNAFVVKKWTCREDCDLILFLGFIDGPYSEEKYNEKRKRYSLKKNITYSFDFSDFNSVKVEKVRKFKTRNKERTFESSYSKAKNTTELQSENNLLKERIAQLEKELDLQKQQQTAQILQNNDL